MEKLATDARVEAAVARNEAAEANRVAADLTQILDEGKLQSPESTELPTSLSF